MQLEMIDVTGLPEQVVEDIHNLVQSIRKNLPAQALEPRTSSASVTLPRWEGTVLGSMSRRELYDDVGCRAFGEAECLGRTTMPANLSCLSGPDDPSAL